MHRLLSNYWKTTTKPVIFSQGVTQHESAFISVDYWVGGPARKL